MKRNLFKLVIWKRYFILRYKPGPFRLTGMFELEVGLRRWL